MCLNSATLHGIYFSLTIGISTNFFGEMKDIYIEDATMKRSYGSSFKGF